MPGAQVDPIPLQRNAFSAARPAYLACGPSSSSIRQQLIVFGRAVGAGERAGLDLPAMVATARSAMRRILGLARAVPTLTAV